MSIIHRHGLRTFLATAIALLIMLPQLSATAWAGGPLKPKQAAPSKDAEAKAQETLPMPDAPMVPDAAKASLAKLGLTVDTLPVIDGSTSTQPLAMLLAATAVNKPVKWELYQTLLMLRPDQKIEDEKFLERVQLSRTHGSYVALIEKEADLILVAREPSEDEQKLAAEKGVELDVKPIALDALIFIVNDQNPVDALTLEQIKSIYRGDPNHGDIKNWSVVGGNDKPIHGIRRQRNSGSQELMDKLVMKGEIMASNMGQMFMGMRLVIDTTRVNPDAIGYTIYYYQRYMMPEPGHFESGMKTFIQDVNGEALGQGPGWKPIAINGVVPSPETFADRSYPLTEPVYVVTRKGDGADAPATKLRDWLLTKEGQQLVKASGYTPYHAAE